MHDDWFPQKNKWIAKAKIWEFLIKDGSKRIVVDKQYSNYLRNLIKI